MNRLFCTIGSVTSFLLISACEPSTPPKPSIHAPRAADTVFYVGARVPLYSLLQTDSGRPYSPGPTTRSRVVFATSNGMQLSGDSLFALNPGALLLEVRDDAAGWVTQFRVGSVYDIRRQFHFESLCRTAQSSGYDNTYTLTDFVSTAPATIINSPALDGRPHWATDGRPIVMAVVAGVSTDSVFHTYLHSNNHVYPDTSVVTTSVASFITADSSTNIQYTAPNGLTGKLQQNGVMSWGGQFAPICTSTATGGLYATRAQLDAR